MATEYDVIVVGAGIHGLCASHTFLSLDSSLRLLIIDDKSSVGGVWATEQLYPGLRSNNLQGWYEFTDFPILEADLGRHSVKERELLTGETLNAYFAKYAEHFDLIERIRFRTTVLRAEYSEAASGPRWTLFLKTVQPDGEKLESKVTCGKLIVATGQASRPLTPAMMSMAGFQKPIIHSTDLGKEGPPIVEDITKKHITVLGGSKSAHDIVYMFASAGKRVTWITRRTGRGTMPMARTYSQMGPWKLWLEGLLMTRSLSWFGAAPWSTGDGFGWIRWLLHSTRLGRAIVKGYWTGLTGDSMAQSGIMQNEKTKALLPDASLMWYGTQANCLTYETDFYELVSRDNVEIIRENVAGLEEGKVVLDDGRKIDTDILFCATGYKFGPTFPLEPREKRRAWGMPVESETDDLFPKLDIKADAELFSRFPELRQSPATEERQPELTPWRLWRFIAPPSQVLEAERSLVFLNTITSLQTCLKCEITSLWAYAYLHSELNVQPESETAVTYEAALWSRFGKWSRPMGMKGKTADFMVDSIPYYDCLLRDLGLRSWRKGWGILGEVFGKWYELKDYRGLLDEWKGLREKRLKKYQ